MGHRGGPGQRDRNRRRTGRSDGTGVGSDAGIRGAGRIIAGRSPAGRRSTGAGAGRRGRGRSISTPSGSGRGWKAGTARAGAASSPWGAALGTGMGVLDVAGLAPPFTAAGDRPAPALDRPRVAVAHGARSADAMLAASRAAETWATASRTPPVPGAGATSAT
ncbi:MAG: hypothetical protein M3066_19925, partial [Actinomycetota bacterium]|nr:hypothetical protein [Actinomycetota bacterium]